uniref:Na+/K+/2Cl-cotransporter n=1 Tax=Cypridopsis vidua TaxID=230730 RepID=A0A4D6TW96_9CRUS|nr:Na+/K+/2Cl- cotransporter [Cypridopsis vidua]
MDPNINEDRRRFQVARIDTPQATTNTPPFFMDQEEADHAGGVAALQIPEAYNYDATFLASLHQMTREAFPREMNYRNLFSIAKAGAATRPTLPELMEPSGEKREDDTDVDAVEKKGVKLGWILGVFLPCLLNIWGVMLFLRLTWVMGQGGVFAGIGLLTLCNLVTFITALSVSAVSTNGQIKGGGIYYMISRSLGAEFGGAIGLMFTVANCIACSMHTIGFCEAVQEMLRTDFKTFIVDDAKNDIRIVGVIALIACLIIVIVGMQWVARIQVVLLVMLLAAQVSVITGAAIGPYNDDQRAQGFLGFHWDVFVSNFAPKFSVTDGVQHSFFSVFAVYFPAVTGIVAGANLSGDLKDPGYAIPLGTLAAIAGTYFSYVLLGLISAASVMRVASGNITELYMPQMMPNSTVMPTPMPFIGNVTPTLSIPELMASRAFQCEDIECKFGLLYNYQTMTMMSSWGPMIYIGCFAASLSSAIATLCSAPRVLQAMAQDKLYPGIGPFGVGFGSSNDPVRGTILSFVVAVGFLLIAELNAVGTLTSNFYLAAYSLVNFCVFHAELAKSPGWRPGFKYYTAWLSLLGTVLCIAAMFLVNWITALITYGLIVLFYLFVQYREPDANWGSSMQAAAYSGALKAVHDLSNIEEHVKNFRPQILCMSGFPGARPPLVDFANLITKHSSLLICGNIIDGNIPLSTKANYPRLARAWLNKHRIRAFYKHVEDGCFEHGCKAMLQLVGLGNLRPNMILLGYKSDWRDAPREDVIAYVNVVHAAFERIMAVGILRVKGGLDYSSVLETVICLDEVETDSQTYNGDENVEANMDDNVNHLDEVEKKKPKKQKNQKPKKLGQRKGPAGYGDVKLPTSVFTSITRFQQKQAKGFIDVYWLYDDGGLTILIPFILQRTKTFINSKLRIFTVLSRTGELEEEQRNMAKLLTKFRIEFADLIVIPDVQRKAQPATKELFLEIIEPCRRKGQNTGREDAFITDEELEIFKEKNNRHMRLRELLLEYSAESTMVVMTLPLPRRSTISAPLYMAWLELLTREMPPMLLVRGNQQSVLTFYS